MNINFFMDTVFLFPNSISISHPNRNTIEARAQKKKHVEISQLKVAQLQLIEHHQLLSSLERVVISSGHQILDLLLRVSARNALMEPL
jgi:hypothetical protein